MSVEARPRARAVTLAGAVMLVVVGLDQLTKHTVGTSVVPGQDRTLIPGVLHLVYERNTGVAFSELSGSGAFVYVPIAAALAAVLALLLARPSRPWLWLPSGMLIGGAVSNLIDRIATGSVIDFLKLPDWPAFNVADISITFGAIALAIVIEFGARQGESRVAVRDQAAGRSGGDERTG